MIRAVFTSYLIMAVLIGPSLCCCTAGALLQSVVAQLTAQPRANSAGGHCHRHVRARPRSAQDSPSRPLKDSCPCRQGSPALVLANLKSSTPALPLEHSPAVLLDLDLANLAPLDFPSAAAHFSSAEDAPIKDGNAILRAYQHYRC